MTIENGIRPGSGTAHLLGDVRATTGEYLEAGIQDVLLQSSPLAAIRRMTERQLASGGAVADPAAGVYALAADPYDPVHTRPRDVPMLSAEDAGREYGHLGLKFDAPVAAGEAELLADTKKRELAAASTFRAARAPAFETSEGLGFGRGALSVAVDFFGSALDPINLMSAFLPIVGPSQRVALAGTFGRVGGGAAAGIAEGTVGAALIEPLMFGSARLEQRDYDWSDSLTNIAFGGVLGGSFGAIGGWLGRGGPPPTTRDAAAGGGPIPSGPPPLPQLGDYARGWQAAIEASDMPVPAARTLQDFTPGLWSPEAPMVRALEQVSPETRRIAGQVATQQYLNGRAIDVEPVLKLDPDWKSPAADPVAKLQLAIESRRIAGLLPSPAARLDPLAEPVGSGRYQDFDPAELTVDARRFQFKAGGDRAGVTDRLAGVTKWDQRLAGVGIVWQDKSGKLFVVDGHQRHGLAKRLGGDAKIHAIVLREADGETEGFARALAAFKNVAEGSGTAIDAAKILRETAKDAALKADLDAGRLPPLPPSSVLVRDAGALARLPDDAFGVVAAGKVEPNQAAHVTRILQDPKQQAAAIEMLAKLSPDTSEQARLIVEQIRASGFREGETVDLFGRQDVAASLMLERAKVLEAAARALKKDAAVFRTLIEREQVAAEAGNVLARDANLERLSDDRAALAVLEALSNRAGPIASALNEAARALADGRSMRSVSADFLKAVRAEAGALRRPGSAAQGAMNAMADPDGLFRSMEDFRKASAETDTIGDPAALDRQKGELAGAPKDPDLLALTEAEKAALSAEAKQAIAADPALKAHMDAAAQAAGDADLFGKAADALATCRITGGA